MNLKPDLQLSVVTAQSIVDRAVSGHRVAAVTRVHGGEIAAVYEITFASDTQASLVLKAYPDALHWKMQKEVTVLGLVGDCLSVPAPHILFADDSKRLLDLNFIVMTKLHGSKLGLGGLEDTLAPDQLRSAYEQIGQLLREFHRIPMDAFGYIGATGILTPHATNHAYLTHQFKRKLGQFVEHGGAASLAQKIAAYAAQRDQLLHACSRAVLCHNDLHAGNLLATVTDRGLRLTGVLDFEGALAGDPLMDVAKACFYLGEETKRALLAGYGNITRDHWSETLDLYHLYFVLELWCWMAEIGNREPLNKLATDLEKLSAR
jgi:aminoglycoside phosphotransferase (APT) family kinase protein